DQQHHGGGADGAERGVDELAPAHAAVDSDGDDDRVDHRDAGTLGGGEDTRAHAAEDDGDEQQPGDGDGAEVQDPLEAREGVHRIAAMAGDEIGGEHQRRGEHQPGNDAGGEQVGDGDAAAAGDRVNDHVVAGRQQQRDERRHRRHVDRVVGAVAARLHLRDHQPPDRRGFGDGRAGDAAEQGGGRDVDLPEATAQVADHGSGEADDALGDAAADHEVAGVDEEGDGEQREDAHARVQALENDQRRYSHIEHGHEG